MKIIFLVALILAVLTYIESYEGAQHILHYAPENPDLGAQHMMYYAQVNQEQDAQNMFYYAPVDPEQDAQNLFYYAQLNPDQDAQHMIHHAPVNQNPGPQHMIHHVPVNQNPGPQHMIHHAPVNQNPGAKHMIHRAPVKQGQGAQHMIHRAPVKQGQGAQHMIHHAPVKQGQGAQHMIHHAPVNQDPGARRNAQVHLPHCGLNNRRECGEGRFIYEYYTPEYSAEREYTYESHFWPIRRTFCPKRYSWPCPRRINECCSDLDCDPIQLCCFESCGNTCQFPVSLPTDGIKVKQHDPYCQVDHMFRRPPMPPQLLKG